jgi:catechol 2,3-dioxygenase-like lactoylglutathione lyase family enzyme
MLLKSEGEQIMVSTDYKVTYIRIGVSDLQKAQDFYEGVMGLPIISKNIEDGYLLFNLTGITLIIERSDEDHELCPCRYLGISLKVKDIFQTYEAFSNLGVKFSHPPEKQFWGGHLTEFQDPDGNIWTLLG